MTLNDFIAATQKVIADNGFENYMPTLAVESRRRISFAVLEDVPPDEPVESFVMEWVSQVVKAKQDYFVAFRIDGTRFKVVFSQRGLTDEKVVTVKSCPPYSEL